MIVAGPQFPGTCGPDRRTSVDGQVNSSTMSPYIHCHILRYSTKLRSDRWVAGLRCTDTGRVRQTNFWGVDGFESPSNGCELRISISNSMGNSTRKRGSGLRYGCRVKDLRPWILEPGWGIEKYTEYRCRVLHGESRRASACHSHGARITMLFVCYALVVIAVWGKSHSTWADASVQGPCNTRKVPQTCMS